jgi:hypothetical protein
LTEIQSQWFRNQKPLEELFDTYNDPYELHNLADDPEYREKLSELGTEMDDWLSDINDLGFIPEQVLIDSFWPEGEQPITEPPVYNVTGNDISLMSATEGANIGYQIIDPGMELEASWQVYQEPIILRSGQSIKALAHRIGYAPSEQVNFELD